MPVIPVTLHNIIDYVAGAALLALPPVLGLSGAGSTALQAAGGATLVLSLLTAYRFSVARLIPFRTHLMLDVGLGILMLIAAGLTSSEGLPAGLLLVAGVIYLAVPAFSWPRR